MPSNYTGDPAGNHSPSPVPAPENFPIVAIPLATEGRTVSSITQMVQTLADHIAWLKKPFGIVTVTQKFLQRWRTAVGHTRFAFDRNGLPTLTFLHWQEWWARQGGFSSLTGVQNGVPVPGTVGGWVAFCTAGTVSVNKAGISGTRHSFLGLVAGGGNGDFVSVQSGEVAQFHADADIAIELIASVQDTSSPDVEMTLGAANASISDPRSNHGLRFFKTPGTANWQAAAKNGSGETVVDTGVAAAGGVDTRFRIEYRGANVNDGGTAAAYFFISQTLVATITNTLPLAAAPVLFSAQNKTGSSPASQALSVGPVNYACNVMPSVTT